jgi:hypothetical protein
MDVLDWVYMGMVVARDDQLCVCISKKDLCLLLALEGSKAFKECREENIRRIKVRKLLGLQLFSWEQLTTEKQEIQDKVKS